MQALKVTRTYTYLDEVRTFTNTWAAGRVGHGTAIHLLNPNSQPICGSGMYGRGTRMPSARHRTGRFALESVTCKKCLTKLAEAQADTAGYVIEVVNA